MMAASRRSCLTCPSLDCIDDAIAAREVLGTRYTHSDGRSYDHTITASVIEGAGCSWRPP